MMSASADSSGSYEKQQMELSQSYGSSVLDYSEDTFEPSSVEEEPHLQPKQEASELSWVTEDLVSDTVESTSQCTDHSHTDEQSAAVDSAAAEREVLGKWIALQTKGAGLKQDKSVSRTPAERTEFLGGELEALGSFCTLKISQMHQQLSPKQPKGGKRRRLQQGLTARQGETSDANCLVPDQLMNRICLQNSRETLQQVIEAQIHEPSVCPDCQKKEAELARITFLRQKKVLMESALIHEKLEEQMYSRDVITLLGEALRSLPKPSEDLRNLTAKAERSGNVRPESRKHNSRT